MVLPRYRAQRRVGVGPCRYQSTTRSPTRKMTMSTDAATQFLEKVAADPALQDHAKVIAGGQQDVVTAAVALGSEHGFKFTAQEFTDVVNEVREAGSAELNDAQLGDVAGGAAYIKREGDVL